ncbi:NrtA/SsuA/CpmA family ABC transporter substrate-binding protein [Desulfoscipio sp. XC116]|uniref:NrtA/SsuA/CpmA family ABC transporter substrate-binding protein n=1 Tax=Desulfoscipio sp. XC116 TaxID=3144975 RepID=UPI00325AB89B
MERIWKIVALVALAALLTAGCGGGQNGSPEQETGSREVKNINISYVKLPLNIPSIIEKKTNLFEEEFQKDGINVTFPEITEGPKMTEALASGSLDFCNALGGTSAILAAANGVDLKVIGIYSRAPKAFTIMARDENIKSVSDLQGKKVAGPKGTILHQLLLASLEEKGSESGDVDFINMSIPHAMSALTAGDVDAALIAGPVVPQALEAGAHIIATGEGLLDATIVIAVSGDFLEQHPDLVKRYMKVHRQSIQYMEENLTDVYKMAAEETGISIETVKQMYGWYDFNPVITDQDITDLQKTQEFLQQAGMLTGTVNMDELIVDMTPK